MRGSGESRLACLVRCVHIPPQIGHCLEVCIGERGCVGNGMCHKILKDIQKLSSRVC